MKKNKFKFPFRLIIIVSIGLFFAVFILLSAARSLRNLDFFKIKDIILSDKKENASEFFYLKGRNIFSLDLIKEAQEISELYPNYRRIRLIRLLPNRLYVDFVKRKAVACVKLYRNFYVDDDLVLFDMPQDSQVKNSTVKVALNQDLPVITGLETKVFGAKAGKKYDTRELEVAIDIIKEVAGTRRLKDYSIEKINVANTNNISFLFSGGIEVRMGQENINDKIDALGGMLLQAKNDLNNIEYIDLRFKDAVIKYKNAK